MTLGAVSWALDQDLPCEEKFVLFLLADIGSMNASRHVDVSRLCKKCSLHPDRVAEIIDDLQAMGLLEIESRVVGKYVVWLAHGDRHLRDEALAKARAESQMMKIGRAYVYVGRAEHGSIKIGLSIDLKQRRRGLQHQCGSAVTMLWHHECSMDAARQLERAILDAFAANRRFGEWLLGIEAEPVISAAKRLALEIAS